MRYTGMLVRRDALFRRISALVLEEGFSMLTVGALAARFHCSRSTLYALAPSKPQLVSAVLDSLFHEIESRLLSAPDPVRAIRHALVTGQPGMSAACYADMIGCAGTKARYGAFTRRRAQWLRDSLRAPGFDSGFLAESAEAVLEAIESGDLPERAGRPQAYCVEQLGLLLTAARDGSAPLAVRS